MTDISAAKSTKVKNLAVFIDADNLNDPTALDHVLTTLRSMAERVLYKRAYGRSESLKVIESVLWRHGVRPVANMIVNKVTTDSALVIDAVEAVCRNDIDAVAICSGDADFVPLATWIRERGCHVFCFSLADRIFANPESFYDDVVLLELVEKIEPAAPASVNCVVPAMPIQPPALMTPVPAVPKIPVKPLPIATLTASPPITAPDAERCAAVLLGQTPVQPVRVQLPDEVQRILKALPELREKPQMLNHVVPVLRLKRIFAKTTKSTTFFARYHTYFKLSPTHQPTQVAYVPPRSTPHALMHKTAAEPLKPVKVLERLAASRPAATVLVWPVAVRRSGAPSLLAELHGLRSVLLQLAMRRVSTADVLLAVPEMLQGQPCSLSAVAGRLREKGLLRPYQSALRVLERHPDSFVVETNCTPQAVIYLR